MFIPLVVIHDTLFPEQFTANFALKRSLTRVDHFMFAKGGHTGECFGTVGTLERPLPRVNALVAGKISGSREPSGTETTTETSLKLMEPYVDFPFVHGVITFATIAASVQGGSSFCRRQILCPSLRVLLVRTRELLGRGAFGSLTIRSLTVRN